jgi:hypothetical protein
MQDRPTYDELLAFIETFLYEEVVPNTPGSRGFHARVAGNAIRIIRRELEGNEEALTLEWEGLNALLGQDLDRPLTVAALTQGVRSRNSELCERIRVGDLDFAPVYDHVRNTVTAKLRATDPALLERSSG